MPNLTIRKRGRKVPAENDTMTPSDSEKHASSSRKLVGTATSAQNKNKNKGSKQKRVEKVVEDGEDDDSEPEFVKDISQQTYTLVKSVTLGDTIIVSDTDFLKHDEFKYREFELHNIRRLDDASKKGGFEFEHVSGSATIAAKGVRVCDGIVITIEDTSSWKKVERGIERYMLTDKKEIIVKLSIVYTKINEMSSDSSEDERRPRKKVIVLVCC
jgi:hypothetical protein